MIGKLTGTIDCIRPSEIIIDVNGVGYEVSIPFSTYNAVLGQPKVSLFIHTHVREDQIRLFGFHTDSEKKLFEVLIQISGIGPSVALSVLSRLEPDSLYNAVQMNDTAPLTAIPGIGKSKAEKLIFELKRKVKKPIGAEMQEDIQPSIRLDAIEALLALGFDDKRAVAMVDELLKEDPLYQIESLVRNALRRISS
jgi:Holliday junction DNA helicase RuvA